MYDNVMLTMVSLVRLLAVSIVAFVASATVVAEPARVEGTWNLVLQLESITGHPVLTLKQDGERLTGTYEGRYGPTPIQGEVKENKIAFAVAFEVEGSKITGAFRGIVDGAKMGGSVEFEGAGSGTWSAERAKAPPK